ncbi:MAG: hypothetical protein M5U34_44090 [Chloroflexi bacterium]|nr:hypothetical protein [Chloroflexota bacterium]
MLWLESLDRMHPETRCWKNTADCWKNPGTARFEFTATFGFHILGIFLKTYQLFRTSATYLKHTGRKLGGSSVGATSDVLYRLPGYQRNSWRHRWSPPTPTLQSWRSSCSGLDIGGQHASPTPKTPNHTPWK